MRKSVKIFALLAFAVALTTVFVGCNAPEAHVHEYGEWTVEKKTDCRHTGKRFRNCIDCGARIEEAIAVDPDAHVFGSPAKTATSACSETLTTAKK